MNKKRKYIPGWLLQKRQEDREIIEKSTVAMQKYYAELEIKRRIDLIKNEEKRIQEEIDTVSQYEKQKNNVDLHEEKNVKPQISIQNQLTKKDSKFGYATESADDYLKRTSDPTAFQDQFIPSIIDPRYKEWALRLSLRSIRTGDMNSPASIAANAAMNLATNFIEDDIKKKENVQQRYNRRIFESNLSFVNKDKDLTADEVNEIITYKTITDPKWGWDRIEQVHKEIELNENQNEPTLKQPEDYFGKDTSLPVGLGGSMNIGNRVASLVKSAWAKSFLSDFILRTNESQMQVGEGLIQRSKEFTDMADRTYQNLDLIEQYANNLRQLQRFNLINYWNKPTDGKHLNTDQLAGLDPQRRHLYELLLVDNQRIREALKQNDWWKDANNLASWAPTKLGLISGLVDKVIDDDIGGVRVGLYGLGDKLDNLQKLLQTNDYNEKWIENITNRIGDIKRQLTDFNKTNADVQEKWRSQMATDIQDLIDWRSGDNWMGMRAQVDPYYEQQKTLIEKNGFKILNDPVQAAQFGFSGVAGGSNSSWWKSIISLGSKVAGAAANYGTGGGWSLFQLGMIGTSFEADKSAGSDENNIESSDRTKGILSKKLQAQELEESFIKEGEQQLKDKKINGVNIGDHIKNLNEEEKIDFIKDAFLGGLWHSKDPKITKMHADAVIGSNNQFYRNQPVNTADAAIGSIVDIASLSTVKYLARATKLVGASAVDKTKSILNSTGIPEKVGLKFAGFKTGIHNSNLFTEEMAIASQLGKGVGKVGGTITKAIENSPIGIGIGAVGGSVAGNYATDGNTAGIAAGAAAGAVAGRFLPGLIGKGLRRTAKALNVEDKIFDAYQATRAFATRVPSAWLHAANVAKTTVNVTGRLGLDTGSELLQEGVQALNARGELVGDPQYNTPLAFRVFDDILLGAKAAWIWLNQNDPEMKSESDVWSQMNATPLLTLLGPGQVQTIIQTHKGIKTANIISAINNNIDAERRANVAELEQGYQYAKQITKEDNKRMHDLFGMYKKIAGIHRDAAERRTGKDAEALNNSDLYYIPEEVINEQEKDYEDIYELARSLDMAFLAKRAGFIGRDGHIKRKYRDQYAKLVSYESFKRKKLAEKEEAFEQKIKEASSIFGPSFIDEVINKAYGDLGVYGEEYTDTESLSEDKVNALEKAKEFVKNKVTTPFERVRLLAKVATLMQIVDDYSKLDEISPRNEVFLSEMKKRLNAAKQDLSDLGVTVNSLEEINDQMLSLDDATYVKQLITRAFGEEVLEGKTLQDYFVPFFTGILREAELASYDKWLETEMYNDFHRDPVHYLRMWDNRKQSDEKLEEILEEDYVNTIREWEKASTREVRDGDVYRGYDGYYIVKKVGDGYKKYRYYPRTDNIGKVAMDFDLLEYNKSKETYEEDLKKERATEAANRNILNGSVDEEAEAEEIEQPVEEEVDLEAPIEDAEETIEYSKGSYLEVEDPDTGETYPAIVVKLNEDSVEVESPTGQHKIVSKDQIKRYINSPISPRKFESGTELYDKNGKKITVASHRLVDIDEDTMSPHYVYDVVNEDGEVILVDESTLQHQYSKEVPSSVVLQQNTERQQTEEQKKMQAVLEEKYEKQKKELGNRKPTAHDYFIKIGNTIRRFIRVHGLLDPLFDESSEDRIARINKENELKVLYDENKEEFVKEVQKQQEEYNKKLADIFGEDSTEYEFYKVNVDIYLTGPRLRDPEIVGIIASILSSSERSSSLIVGTFIDEIARDFFDGKEVINHPKYKMSNKTFESFVSQLKDLSDRFNELKWDVYTKEFVWHGKTAQGVNFAGATDLIAIDKQGNVHILDFKTTRKSRIYKAKYEYEKDGRWVTVLSKDLIPEGATYRITSDFITQIATKDSGTVQGNRSYASQYARQLAAYRYLIQLDLPGAKVVSMEIIPMYLKYDNDQNGKILSISSVQLFENINLSEIQEIQKDVDDMDNFLTSTTVNDKKQLLEEAMSVMTDKIDRIDEVLNSEDKGYISGNTIDALNEQLAELLSLLKLITKTLDSSTKVSDSVYVDLLIENYEQIVKKVSDTVGDAEYEMAVGRLQDLGEESGPEEESLDEHKGKRAWLYEKLEKVVESARQYWWQFNNLHSWSDKVRGNRAYQEAVAQRDFITEGEFIITRDDANDLDVFHVIVRYKDEVLTQDPITIRLGNESKGRAKNYDSQGSDLLYSIMGRNFLRQFYQLREIMKPGDTTKVIVASRLERTNGQLTFGEEHHSLEDTPFLLKNDPRYGSMLDGENSIIGVANDRGEIVEISDSKRTVLLSPSEDLDGNIKNPKNRDTNLPGNQGNKIPAGTVYFLYRFKNEEDPAEAPDRKVPIALKGRKLENNNANSIINILREIAKTGRRTGTNTLIQCIDKNGNAIEGKTVPGLTLLKTLNLFTRFGQNAFYAGHEFQFDWARSEEEESGKRKIQYNYTQIEITDIRQEPKEINGILGRETIKLDLTKNEDINTLKEILSLLDMHINQFGKDRLKLDESTSTKGAFGDLTAFFNDPENKDIDVIRLGGDLFITREDVEQGLSGIEWMIKHNLAQTNIEIDAKTGQWLSNPLISIHELDIKKKGEKGKKKPNVAEKPQRTVAAAPEETMLPHSEENDAPAEDEKNEEELPDEIAYIMKAMESLDDEADEDMPGIGGGLTVMPEELRPTPLSDEEKTVIENRIQRLVGKVAINWTSRAISTLRSGAVVAGRTALTAFKLYDRITEGGEYHESFHRIFEILIPNSVRRYLYDDYYKKYNKSFKEETGRDLRDRDISEAFAEMFRHFMLDREHINFDKGILNAFVLLKNYIVSLYRLGSVKYAALFLAANSGIFRYVKPNPKNVQHFQEVLKGHADITLSMMKDGERKTVDLDQFPDIGGKDLFNDAVEAIIYALCTSYSVDYLARNAASINADLASIQRLFKGKETTEHSAWFRVITGEYANEGDKMSIEDAQLWKKNATKEELNDIRKKAAISLASAKGVNKNDKKILLAYLIKTIIETLSNLPKEQLDPRQRMMAQLFSKEIWPFVEKKVNNRLKKMGIDSELITYEEYVKRFEDHDSAEPADETGNQISTDVGGHGDLFFDHSRTDDATAAIRFFLSSIPDERFATEDDVKAGTVKSTTRIKKRKNGSTIEEPVMIKNRSSLMGFNVFLSMKEVGLRLLSACHKVRNATELDNLLQQLAKEDAMFYRIAKKYHNAKENEIVRWENSGKNKITKDGLFVDENDYEQHYDESGVYYTWVKDGKDTGEVILGAVTQVDPDMESFVTQLFNFVACQKLDFIRVKFSLMVDEDGNEIEDSYETRVEKTSDDYASSIFPKQWFAMLKGGITGIFGMTTGGKYKFEEGGKEVFEDAIDTIGTVSKILRTNSNKQLHGKQYNLSEESDVRLLIKEYVSALNTLGIDISTESFVYGLHREFGNERNLSFIFREFVSSTKNTLSHLKLEAVLDNFKKDVTKNEFGLLSESRPSRQRTSKFEKDDYGSGINLYSDNATIKWFASTVAAYNKESRELMTNGPEGTKRYLMAQSHTASDITDDINLATCVTDKNTPKNKRNITGSKIIKDMKKYVFNFLEKGRWSVEPIGSLIIKHILQHGKIDLKLHTHGGVMVENDTQGGVSYDSTTEREDWLAKAAILRDGGIIFPTLSDKSTWFYLTGVNVPGIDYSNLGDYPVEDLPLVGLYPGEKLSSTDVHLMFNWNATTIAQIDQMIEYAECEKAAIEKEINRKGFFPFIEYFEENRKRFGGLTEIYKINSKGELQLVLFNDYNETPEDCLKRANEEFFNLPRQEQRRRMVLTLEQGFKENLDLLERTGLIKADGVITQDKLDDKGNKTGDRVSSSKWLQYSNIGLSSFVIDKLTTKYQEVLKNSKEAQHIKNAKARSMAILAYTFDIYMRGVISNEETQRMYTGQMLFYKWVTGKIKDVLSGRTINCIIDAFSDFSKRLGGLGSTGEKNRTDLHGIKRTYKCAEIEDVKVASPLLQSFTEIVILSSVKQAYLDWKEDAIKQEDGISEQEIKDKLKEVCNYLYQQNPSLETLKKEMEEGGAGLAYDIAYASGTEIADVLGTTKPADGAAFISPKMTENLLRMRGKFDGNTKKAFEYLTAGVEADGKPINPLRAADAYRTIVNAVIGTQKYSAYGYRINDATDDIPVHYYDKFALFPLFKCMATGFTSAVYSKMDEQEIDMIMMHSGVKTGSEGASKFDPVAINEQLSKQNGKQPTEEEVLQYINDFEFHTYDQDYMFIRRQLNTDPHEKDTTTMGTQMTKVALSTIKPWNMYKVFVGETEDGEPLYEQILGEEVLDNIMDAINELSNLGKENIKELLMNEDGTIDIDKFSAFLEDELDMRDADANLIDGVQVVEREHTRINPDTGEKETYTSREFKVELEAMSSIDWIQSIIVSKINKEVCDINVKGNAFYQRPAWGVEGKPVILDDETVDFVKRGINNGQRLNEINNDGSMDSVISIDFFYDILPSAIRDNFEKSREWLLKHKIIGNTEDVHACCINARIPTQGPASIGALRFVDVLPVVRDTIILPSSITKIDGSDFDIDKRYLVRLSYNIKYGKTKEEGDIVSTVFDKNSENRETRINYYRNRLIHNYMSLLKSHGRLKEDGTMEDGDSSHTAMSSVDKDTELVTSVRDKINAVKPKERYYAYKFGNLAFLVMTRLKFAIGKFGIGPFALNNNNQILTQLYNVRFAKSKYKNILDSLGCLSLANDKDKQGNRILSWLSGLINVHVDIAKNPNSIDGLNINKFTYNLVNLLIRTGMGERSLFFTAQPVMTELSKAFDDAGGQFMVDLSKSKTANLKNAVDGFIYDNFGTSYGASQQNVNKHLLRSKNEGENSAFEEKLGSIAQALFGIDDDGKYNSLYVEYKDESGNWVHNNDNSYPEGSEIRRSSGFLYYTLEGELVYKKGCILEDILENQDVLVNSKKPVAFNNLTDDSRYKITYRDETGKIREADISAMLVQEYVAYIQNCLNNYASKLSDLVNVCKIDTKKHGKNYVEQQAYLDKYRQVFDNEDGVFEQQGLDDLRTKSYIETKTINATELYELILGTFSIQATKTFKIIHDLLLIRLGSTPQNKKLSAKATKAIMTYIKNKFFKVYVEQHEDPDYYGRMFYGDNKESIQGRILRFKNLIKKDKTGKYAKYGKDGVITNPLIKALQADVYDEREGFDNPQLIMLENSLLEDSDTKNALERAWDEMYQDRDIFIEEDGKKIYWVRDLARDLAVYAFFTSGDQKGKTAFFDIVPNTIRLDISAEIDGELMTYNDFIRRTREDFLNEISQSETDRIVKDVIFENWKDDDFVKNIPYFTKRGSFYSYKYTKKGKYIDISHSLVREFNQKTGRLKFVAKKIAKKITSLIIGATKYDGKLKESIGKINGFYPEYIKSKRPSADRRDSDNTILYELIGINSLGGAETYPIYRIVKPVSAKMRGGTYYYNLYGLDLSEESPIFPISVQEVINFYMHNDPVTESDDIEQIKKEITDAFNEQVNWMADEELKAYIEKEYELRNMKIEDDDVESIIKHVKKNLKWNEETKTNEDKRYKPKQSQYDVKFEKGGSVEIWWGTENTRINGQLSNMAPRKVKYNGVEYKSVESAFLALKVNYSSMTEDQKQIYAAGFENLEGKEAREFGGKVPMLNKEEWDKNKRRIMKEIMLASFEQNEKDRKMLLSTKDATLTHEHARKKDEWRTLFPEILTEVRSELLETHKDEVKNKKSEKKSEQKPKDSLEKAKGKESKTINVYEEIPELKNSTIRPFVYKGLRFLSVMQAYNIAGILTMKGLSDETKMKYMNEILRTTDMNLIKSLKSEVNHMKGVENGMTKEQLSNVLEELMYLSIKQDEEATELLLGTGDKELTGDQSEKLTKIRERLKKEQEEQDKTDDEEHDDGPEEICTTKND